MDVVKQVRAIHRSHWSRLVAVLLMAAATSAFVPQPAVAAEHRCHMPVPQNVLTAADDECGQCAQASCVAMPGCAHVLAVMAPPAEGPLASPAYALAELEAPRVHHSASRGPPTPPPNS